MKHLLLFLIVAILPEVVCAEKVQIDGVYYNLLSKIKEAEVTYGNYLDGGNDPQYHGEIIIPSSVVYQGLEYVVTSIGGAAFRTWDKSQITSIQLPNTIKKIGATAFSGCDLITNLEIPDNVEEIEDNAFSGCSSLATISLPPKINKIQKYTFSGCTNLQTIFLPESINTIEMYAFENCISLKELKIPNEVSVIGKGAFRGCHNITEIELPLGVEEISENLFSNCTLLRKVSIPTNVTKIGKGAFYYCTSLESLILPSNLISIEEAAFIGCSSIKEVSIPNSVISIKARSFVECNGLKTIVLGKNVLEICELAFSDCYSIEDFYCYAANPPTTSNDAFNGSYIDHATLYIPTGSIDIYKESEPWKNFKNIVKIDMPTHTLTYLVDNEVYKIYEIEEEESITPEPAPTKEGYTFSGWSEIPETMPAHDVTVTGSFNINSYKLTYMIDDKVYKETMYEYGATIIPEPQPEGDYATFEWIDLPQTMPARDVVVYASYTSGIVELLMPRQQNVRVYSPNGKRLNSPQKGVNIIRMSNGRTKKIVVK